MAQWQTLRRALRGDKEATYKAIGFVIRKLPVTNSAKRSLAAWSLAQLVDRERKTLRAQILSAQKEWEARGQQRLKEFLAGDETIECPAPPSPKVSFIVVLRDKAHLSILSIESILRFADVSYELILVDNGSTDLTSAMLDRIAGAKILRHSSNLGFGPACMSAAEIASGEYLCFFNNDALLTAGAISAALDNFERASVGAVGGKILLANGRLQEAGSIIWSDGSALGYGRNDNPALPRYNFPRPVDYCSAVFLITPRQTFEEVGGFGAEFAPAYYEDADYCMKLWEKQLKVIYEPLAEIEHYESASSGGNEYATDLMMSHRQKFRAKWSDALQGHYSPAESSVCAARISVNSRSLRILYIDDRIPENILGAGFPRSVAILRELVQMGCHVTCSSSTYPLLKDFYTDIPREVEVFDGFRFRDQLINEYLRCADLVWVSRPHNLKLLLTESRVLTTNRNFVLVYDAEAIFSDRVRNQKLLFGDSNRPQDGLEVLSPDEEFSVAKHADCVCVVSEADRRAMQNAGVPQVRVVSYKITAAPTAAGFSERDAFLFVGAVHGTDSPNADSIRHFCRTAWADVHRLTGAPLVVAGYGTELLRDEITDPTVSILGPQEDLTSLYARARVFVVPTRYAAGIPLKAYEAAGFGIPLVVSQLIATQMNWGDGKEYLSASTPDSFAEACVRLYRDETLWETLRGNALVRIQSEFSPEAFTASVKSVVNEMVPTGVTHQHPHG